MFPGFPAEGIQFLRNLKRHNKREWFQPRKHIFDEKVRQPMMELVDSLNEHLHRFAPHHMNDPAKAIYRIYRDTRFSNDKTPYKTHIAAIFPRRGHQKHASAGFYIGISPEGVEVAGGLYMPGPQELLAVRNFLAENHKDFRKAAALPRKLMGDLHGDSLQRVPKGFPAEHPAADLLKMKQWLYYKVLDADLATSPQLPGELVKRFKSMSPVMEMLNTPLKTPKKAAFPFDDEYIAD
ncbi:MAG: DUF2461 domain-containing protein [Bryobacteraceae bacterium]